MNKYQEIAFYLKQHKEEALKAILAVVKMLNPEELNFDAPTGMTLTEEIQFYADQQIFVEDLDTILMMVKRINADDILSPEDIAAIEESREEFARGEYVLASELNFDEDSE